MQTVSIFTNMKKNTFISVTTKTGDKGTTALADGKRIAKTDSLFDLIGTIDELNSWLGLVVSKIAIGFGEQREFLLEIQNNLFYVGAELTFAPNIELHKEALIKLEKISQTLQKELDKDGDWHQKFLLPGGCEQGAYLDIARTVCRRAERSAFAYSDQHLISPVILKYLNRLSDYLYVLRCFVNTAVEYREKEFLVKNKPNN